MIPAPPLENDDDRVASLEKMNILDTPREADFDRIVRVTQRYFKTDIVLITLVDKDRQWFKARCGLDTHETSREISFCGHAIESDEIFVVEDARKDARFFDNPLVTGAPHIAFYAGQPLKNAEGYRIGTLCLLSSRKRKFSDDDQFMLEDLGRITEQLLQNRRLGDAQCQLLESISSSDRKSLIDSLSGLWNWQGFASLDFRRAMRKKRAFAAAIIDIDHFEHIAVNLGTKAADDAVRLAADLLIGGSRAGDIVTRGAGGRFQFVTSDVNPNSAAGLGNKILRLFRSHPKLTAAKGQPSFTVSVGIAILLNAGNPDILLGSALKTAETALARAKIAGGNRCETERILLPAAAA